MLGLGCPLFARKFPADTAAALLQAEFAMLLAENGARPQGLLLPDNKAGEFDSQCRALQRAAKKSRKQIFVR